MLRASIRPSSKARSASSQRPCRIATVACTRCASSSANLYPSPRARLTACPTSSSAVDTAHVGEHAAENLQIARRLGQRDRLLQHAPGVLQTPQEEESEGTLGLG